LGLDPHPSQLILSSSQLNRRWGRQMKRQRRDKRQDKKEFLFGCTGILLAMLAVAGADSAWAEEGRHIFQKKTQIAQAVTAASDVVPAVKQPVSLQEKALLESIRVPEEVGRVIEAYQGSSDQTIIHIQDAHAHYEAQKNLARIVEEFVRNYNVNVVLIEGWNQSNVYSPMRKLATPEKRLEVAERYLRKGMLSGEAYLELTTDYPMVVQGVEDMELYKENLRAFSKVEQIRGEALPYLKNLQAVIETLKRNVYSSDLKTLEKMREEKAKEAETLQPGGFSDILEDVRAPLMATRTEHESELETLLKEVRLDFLASMGEAERTH